jgi:hypothetical protein
MISILGFQASVKSVWHETPAGNAVPGERTPPVRARTLKSVLRDRQSEDEASREGALIYAAKHFRHGVGIFGNPPIQSGEMVRSPPAAKP